MVGTRDRLGAALREDGVALTAPPPRPAAVAARGPARYLRGRRGWLCAGVDVCGAGVTHVQSEWSPGGDLTPVRFHPEGTTG